MGPFAEAKKNKRISLVAIDHYSSWSTLEYAKSTQISVVKKQSPIKNQEITKKRMSKDRVSEFMDEKRKTQQNCTVALCFECSKSTL